MNIDWQRIVERAHNLGALVLLDVYQSAGSIELDASVWEVDFLIGGTIKWLCGGPACGYLYVRPELQRELRPRLTGWVAHDSHCYGDLTGRPATRRWVGLSGACGGFFDCTTGVADDLASMNDRGMSFADIAKLIRSRPRGLLA